ncbi:universal stress protein [Rhodococcus tukisamuensis]|uniref:Nucleotide-binding universal stress protein, UspA family n=1 Tax=Rhodococcus tukisamuensis TaxID=168276 RepID=A0A1G6PDM2_9NOCA|nr:universal stress protein [Rhodococcus tukisamuensis]SDC78159.1 Nucleotide-binding universal stress protein, UspA family [Rhodococcus tukisamuensis]
MSAGKPVVVGVDGSESASTAVVWAARTAAGRKVPLVLVSVVHVPPYYYSEPYLARGYSDDLKNEGRAHLDSAEVLARSVAEDLGPLEVETKLHEGRIADILLQYSADATMIVLGSRGLGEFTGALLGSVTRAVASHSTAPVAVVRGRTLDGRPPAQGPVVVGVDGSEVSEAAVAVAFAEASARGASLVAVNVWSDVSVQPSLGATASDPHWSGIQAAEEAVLSERLAGWLERYPDVNVQRVVSRDRPVRVLSEYSEQAQLLVVGSHGRGGFKGMVLGSTSNALMNTADCPVLIVRPPARD